MNTDQALAVVGAACLRGTKVLLAQRSAKMSDAGLWEFPGGKIEAGETPQAALKRELEEELNVAIEVGELLAIGSAPLAGHQRYELLRLSVFEATIIAREPQAHEHQELRWVEITDLPRYCVPPADQPAIDALLQRQA